MLTTGGTGPAPRDVTPEATLAVAHKVMPGFGEQMRQVSLHYVPTAILSRQVGVIREAAALILNLPGQPKAIRETLDGVKDADGAVIVPGIFAAVPYCLDLIGGPYIETNEACARRSGRRTRGARTERLSARWRKACRKQGGAGRRDFVGAVGDRPYRGDRPCPTCDEPCPFPIGVSGVAGIRKCWR